jgi:hypothetical protein
VIEKTVCGRLTRLHGTAFLNELANHPRVRPTCGTDGREYLDFTPFVSDPRNHAVAWEHGAFMFDWTAPHTYEVHVMVHPDGRGPDAYRMAKAGIAYIVAEGADRIWARIARDDMALRHYTRTAGFERCGKLGDYDVYQWLKPRRPRCLPR